MAIPSDLISEYQWEQLERHWGLTDPEVAIVKLLFLGRSEVEIARMLTISLSAVHAQIDHIYEILGISTRLHLVLCVLAALRECWGGDDAPWF